MRWNVIAAFDKDPTGGPPEGAEVLRHLGGVPRVRRTYRSNALCQTGEAELALTVGDEVYTDLVLSTRFEQGNRIRGFLDEKAGGRGGRRYIPSG